ncbi:MAG: response regulator transcription factor [Acholeplasmatales bacterium]|nr:response regulator transcription factor [Acholeplasmatales bacterium]
MSKLIYSIEDDENIGYVINKALTNSGYEVKTFTSSTPFYAELEKQIPDILLLDIMLPGESGLEILSKIRKDSKYANIYVIIVSAKDSEFDKVTGLDQGADDYIAKPFGIFELTSKINAIFRRFKDKEVLRVQDISLYVNERKCKKGDLEINLTQKEFDLFKYLLERKPNVVRKEDVIKDIWGSDYGETRTIDMHIKSLRQKIQDKDSSIIVTLHGIGYRIEE